LRCSPYSAFVLTATPVAQRLKLLRRSVILLLILPPTIKGFLCGAGLPLTLRFSQKIGSRSYFPPLSISLYGRNSVSRSFSLHLLGLVSVLLTPLLSANHFFTTDPTPHRFIPPTESTSLLGWECSVLPCSLHCLMCMCYGLRVRGRAPRSSSSLGVGG